MMIRNTTANNVCKTQVIKLLNKAICPESAFVSADTYETRNAQRFIVCGEAEQRQKKVLHAVIEMVATF